MQLSDVPVRAGSVVSRAMDGELVLVHPGQGKVRVLNAVGARLWELVDGRRTVADLAQAVIDEYKVDAARAPADVMAFCSDLQGRGLLSLAER